jgi:hypothetical protein
MQVAQPAASADVGTDGPTYQAVPTVTARAAPVAKPSVPRQILEVGTECVSSARFPLSVLYRLTARANPEIERNSFHRLPLAGITIPFVPVLIGD